MNRWRVAAAGLLAIAWSGLAQAAPAKEAAKDVVAVGGAVTEIVYALGQGERVIATDTTSTYPAAAAALPKVGYQRALPAEGIIALRPRLLIATGEAGPAPVLQQLKGAGVAVTQLSVAHDFAGVLAHVNEIGRVLGAARQAEALNAKLQADWAEVTRKVASYRSRPRVMFILAHAGPTPQIAGRGTAADAMIRLAGGENAVSGIEGYKPLTAEAAVAAAPDVIVTTREGLANQGAVEGLLAKPGLALTPAGKAKRVVALEALLLLGFGPRLPQAVDTLATQLHAPAEGANKAAGPAATGS